MSAPFMLWWLLVGHALCDFPLQNEFLSRAKNHRNPIEGISPTVALLAHALIQGGSVVLVTGCLTLGIAETVCHACIDREKCNGGYSFTADQAYHVILRVLWWVLAQSGAMAGLP